MSGGLLLYGPPAAGKDTITAELLKLDPVYRLHYRLKVGPGRAETYRPATPDEFARLLARGKIIWRNERYDAVYGILRGALERDLREGVPVVHLSQIEAVTAIRRALPGVRWLSVYVHCARDIAEARIIARAMGDTEARLRAWDETPPLRGADLDLDTGSLAPGKAARQIHHLAIHPPEPDVAQLTTEAASRTAAGSSPHDIAEWLLDGPAQGRPILAIKTLAATGLGLSASKRVVDEILLQGDPEHFTRIITALRALDQHETP